MALDFSGRTVVGESRRYIGVELAKWRVGIRQSTMTAGVALPVARGGRLGCFLHGCCYGAVTDSPWAVAMHGAMRHPVQLIEAGADLALAGVLWVLRRRAWPAGHLFRRYLVGYAVIRFCCEFLRGDPSRYLGPLTAIRWCVWSAGLHRSDSSEGTLAAGNDRKPGTAVGTGSTGDLPVDGGQYHRPATVPVPRSPSR